MTLTTFTQIILTKHILHWSYIKYTYIKCQYNQKYLIIDHKKITLNMCDKKLLKHCENVH